MNFSDAGTDLLQNGISIRFPARGQSMHPFILDNDVVQVDPVSFQRIKPGDIVLCDLQRGPVIHRVRSIFGDTIRISADSQGSEYELVQASELKGRVRWIERNGKRILIDTILYRLWWRSRLIFIFLRSALARSVTSDE